MFGILLDSTLLFWFVMALSTKWGTTIVDVWVALFNSITKWFFVFLCSFHPVRWHNRNATFWWRRSIAGMYLSKSSELAMFCLPFDSCFMKLKSEWIFENKQAWSLSNSERFKSFLHLFSTVCSGESWASGSLSLLCWKTAGVYHRFCLAFLSIFFPLRKMGGRFVFKTHLDRELGCMWIAQLQELVPVLGSVARFSSVEASPSHH